MLSGIFLGLIAGVLPGIGNVVTLILVYPFITDFDLFQIVLFYMCLAGSSQYTGSVVATTLAVPGETSSLPAVTEGHRMFLSGRVTKAGLAATALTTGASLLKSKYL